MSSILKAPFFFNLEGLPATLETKAKKNTDRQMSEDIGYYSCNSIVLAVKPPLKMETQSRQETRAMLKIKRFTTSAKRHTGEWIVTQEEQRLAAVDMYQAQVGMSFVHADRLTAVLLYRIWPKISPFSKMPPHRRKPPPVL